ncbi:hypothetical protein F3Y22_tig00110059pilonHSYRG00092 [Hibiscus syriacus]|uniref:Uncharacterized protein n=1 Tax=Hibiscus syriacus TaxID=106335 RepID=A0A6A3BQC5_HIBSY|nr:hypothetical protein F3Y22_tig00110059pilonHSYRG00092 [Hibiscus syriacus]
MDHLSPITQKETVEPLAFVPPDAEEEAVLGDIWKGKATSSGVLYNSYRDTSEGKQSSLVNREDNVDSGEKAAVNNNYLGKHAETYVTGSQISVMKGRKLSFLVVDYQLSIENIFMISYDCPYRNE